MSSSDDEITKKILNPSLESETPTKKTGVLPLRCVSHDDEVQCDCICHLHTTIYHQRACCKICPVCEFKTKILRLNPSEEEEE